jgi:hypothetical protein
MRYNCFPHLLFCSGITIYTMILGILVINTNNLSNRIDDIYESNLFKQSLEKKETYIHPPSRTISRDDNYNEEKYNQELEQTRMRVDNLKHTIVTFKDNIKTLSIDEHHNEEKFNVAIDIISILHNFTTDEYDRNKKKFKEVNVRLDYLEKQTVLYSEYFEKLKK